jgi:Acyl-protein synthetase, LuxE
MNPSVDRWVVTELDTRILRLVHAPRDAPWLDAAFDELALAVFAHQFAHVPAYRSYCESLDAVPGRVTRWSDVPAVPTEAFRKAELTDANAERAIYAFETSGTVGSRPGRILRDAASLALCRAAWLRAYDDYACPDGASLLVCSLAPTAARAPRASIAHCLDELVSKRGAPGSASFVGDAGLDCVALHRMLRAAVAEARPVELYGATFAVADFLDWCHEADAPLRLPPGSRICHGSGYKGLRRELSAAEFAAGADELVGVSGAWIVNVLGMTELASQFYDNTLRNRVLGRRASRCKEAHPWARTRVVDPATGEDADPGYEGVLVHYDLACRGTIMAVQTADLGVRVGTGFEIVGRAAGAEPRGCNLTLEQWSQRVTA